MLPLRDRLPDGPSLQLSNRRPRSPFRFIEFSRPIFDWMPVLLIILFHQDRTDVRVIWVDGHVGFDSKAPAAVGPQQIGVTKCTSENLPVGVSAELGLSYVYLHTGGS